MTSTIPLEFEADSSGNPYPGSDRSEWTTRFSDALVAATGLPGSVADGIAVYVSRPKDYLHRQNGIYRLRPSALVEDGGLQILQVDAHGFTGSPGEYNERIRSAFDSPLRPGARPGLVLPTLATGRTAGRAAPFLTTVDPVHVDQQASLLAKMDAALDDADSDRGYRLIEDIEIYGQKTVTLHAPLVRQIREQTDTGPGIRSVTDLPAIKGANRARARLTLHGLTAKDIVFGFSPYAHMGISRKKDPRSADPTYWVPIFADLLKAAFADPDHPGHLIAVRAAKIATIPIQIIVGAANLDGFHNSVFDPNRADHRRPPLDYKLTEKAASDLRAILREFSIRSVLTEPERAWLSGEGPDPDARPGESLVDARDRRDRTLFRVVFPQKEDNRKLVRQMLGEPAPSQTGRRHVDNRARMVSAVASDGYGQRWNPRILDNLFATSSIKDGFPYSLAKGWATVLDKAAAGDHQALETFIVTRGMHWLAEHKIIEADRGSVGAQTQGTDGDERRIRRSHISIRDALKLNPVRTIGLMRELAHAANAGSKPRQVDMHGNPVEGAVASRPWFDEAFPKTARKQNGTAPDPSDNPEQPEPTPQEKLHDGRVAFEEAVTGGITEAFKNAFDAGKRLEKAAADAGMAAFPENLNDTLIPNLGAALAAARKDAKGLGVVVQDLQHGGGDPADFVSKCAEYLEQEAE